MRVVFDTNILISALKLLGRQNFWKGSNELPRGKLTRYQLSKDLYDRLHHPSLTLPIKGRENYKEHRGKPRGISGGE
ncbi:MAG: hypothetical protein AAB410_02015 [Patescibacteria group bacterium]